jgi:lysophospholipase L1-like esterase
VLNLGTNDASYMGEHREYDDEFTVDYLRFLKLIRQKNPNALIICVYGFTSTNTTVENGINDAISQMQDENVVNLSSMFPGDGSGVNGHPPASAQIKWAETLTNYIKNTKLNKGM